MNPCPFRLSTDENPDLVHRRRDPTSSLEALLVPLHEKQSFEEETAKGEVKLDRLSRISQIRIGIFGGIEINNAAGLRKNFYMIENCKR
jgi:hypothetical protein